MTEKNIYQFNDLWDSLQPILKTAKAIYRGVDEVKLKDYTVTQLTKRIHAEGKRDGQATTHPPLPGQGITSSQ
jgi:hypothetical protein